MFTIMIQQALSSAFAPTCFVQEEINIPAGTVCSSRLSPQAEAVFQPAAIGVQRDDLNPR